MKERIFKCITTFSVITAHLLSFLSSLLYCVSDEIAMLMMVVVVCLPCMASPKNISENEMKDIPCSYAWNCLYVYATLCKLFPRALLCCWIFSASRFFFLVVFGFVPGTSRFIQSSRNCITHTFVDPQSQTQRPREAL